MIIIKKIKLKIYKIKIKHIMKKLEMDKEIINKILKEF